MEKDHREILFSYKENENFIAKFIVAQNGWIIFRDAQWASVFPPSQFNQKLQDDIFGAILFTVYKEVGSPLLDSNSSSSLSNVNLNEKGKPNRRVRLSFNIKN